MLHCPSCQKVGGRLYRKPFQQSKAIWCSQAFRNREECGHILKNLAGREHADGRETTVQPSEPPTLMCHWDPRWLRRLAAASWPAPAESKVCKRGGCALRSPAGVESESLEVIPRGARAGQGSHIPRCRHSLRHPLHSSLPSTCFSFC